MFPPTFSCFFTTHSIQIINICNNCFHIVCKGFSQSFHQKHHVYAGVGQARKKSKGGSSHLILEGKGMFFKGLTNKKIWGV